MTNHIIIMNNKSTDCSIQIIIMIIDTCYDMKNKMFHYNDENKLEIDIDPKNKEIARMDMMKNNFIEQFCTPKNTMAFVHCNLFIILYYIMGGNEMFKIVRQNWKKNIINCPIEHDFPE